MIPLRLVLFDCDGTLVDSQVMIVSAMTGAFEAGGLPPPPREEILSIVGLSLPIAIQRLAGHHPDVSIEALVEAYKSSFQVLRNSTLHHEPLYPGAREALAALAGTSDTLMGIVTGKSRRGVDAILALHDLASYFPVIKTADSSPSKPHPGMVLEAMADMGADTAETVVIGDTSFDMEMARAAGARAIGVSWGYHASSELAQAGAERIVNRYEDVPAAVAALIGD